MKNSKNALVILAGGYGKRFKKKLPKQFNEINGENLIDFFLNRIDTNIFDIILIVTKKSFQNHTKHLKTKYPLIKFMYAEAGKNRQLSSFNALKKLNSYKPNKVLIHDAARPFCSKSLVIKIMRKLDKSESAIPYILSPDKKLVAKKEFNKTIRLIQTPQGFKFNTIYNAHLNTKEIDAKDDSGLIPFEKMKLIKGERLNLTFNKF